MNVKKKILIGMILLIIIGIIQILAFDKSLPEHYVKVDGKLFAYEVYGDGGENILVAVHGSPGSKEDFIDLGSKITNTTIYAIDMIGFGESTLYSNKYGYEIQAQHLKLVVDELGIEKANYLGYSWGGLVVTKFVHNNPSYVNTMILLGGVGVPEGSHTQNYYTEQLRYIVSFPFVTIYPGSFAPDLLSFGQRYGFIRSFGDGDQREIASLMEEIETPVLLIHGDDDHVVEVKAAKIHHELLVNSTLRYYEGGHGVIFNQAQKISNIIEEELQ